MIYWLSYLQYITDQRGNASQIFDKTHKKTTWRKQSIFLQDFFAPIFAKNGESLLLGYALISFPWLSNGIRIPLCAAFFRLAYLQRNKNFVVTIRRDEKVREGSLHDEYKEKTLGRHIAYRLYGAFPDDDRGARGRRGTICGFFSPWSECGRSLPGRGDGGSVWLLVGRPKQSRQSEDERWGQW